MHKAPLILAIPYMYKLKWKIKIFRERHYSAKRCGNAVPKRSYPTTPLSKTNICSDQNISSGNNGANSIPAPGGRSSKRKYFVIAHLRNNFCSKEEMSKFPHSLQNSNANPHYVWVYLLHCCETSVSKMNFIKNELHMCMTNENIHHCLRFGIITLEPKLK